jgi:hypothetical protein
LVIVVTKVVELIVAIEVVVVVTAKYEILYLKKMI